MPITTAVPVVVFNQEEFHAVERRVTGAAFEIHNEFGRYLDEKLYQSELTRRCRDLGLEVHPEMRITVTLDDFSKDYFVDHLINQGIIIETKAVSLLGPAQRGQALNYLFMCGVHHGALINFRGERVQREFVSTRLTPEDRRRLNHDLTGWTPLSQQCERFREILMQLLGAWGGYLDTYLYREASAHFLGGEDVILRDIEVRSKGASVGTQQMHMLTDDIAFSLTTATRHASTVLEHQHTSLRAIQWVNLNHADIELRTITKQ
jgi:GxxExxY protein